MAIDGDTDTLWHTNWDPMPTPALPQSITLDLAGSDPQDVAQLKYLPRQDANYNGVITGYTIYTSTNGVDFNQVASGSWALDFTEKTAAWPSTSATHIKLKVTAAHADFACAAELAVLGATLTADLNNDGAVNLSDFAILADDWLNGYDLNDLADMAGNWLE
jgi:hypothetical protein